MCARKGMIVVSSAGNEGSNSWHYISTPADADSILTVGAVDYTSAHAYFSGYGPTADGRIKPDVCAVGVSSVIANTSNAITTGNGTSFSSPIMAGLVACLWQSLPSFTNMQIINLIKQYSTQYSSPNNSLGYGIPDIYAAYHNNTVATLSVSDKLSKGIVYFANGILHIDRTETVKSPALAMLFSQNIPISFDLQAMPTGFYLLTISDSQSKEQYKLIKQ
jgi:subtilisin family serine protease